MINQIKLSLLLTIACFLVLNVSFVFAQESTQTKPPAQTQTIERALNLDENIQPSDLNISNPKILPNSPFYAFKGVMRGLQSAFTFNKIRKMELKLKFANEKIIETKKMAEKTGNTDNAEILNKSLDNYKIEIQNLEINIQGPNGKSDPKFEQFLDKLADNQIKHQKLIGYLEKKVSEQSFDKISDAKKASAEKLAEIAQIDNPEKFQERFVKMLGEQKGSEFRNFKNLEVLKDVEQFIPEQARDAIEKAQENALERLQNDIKNISPENLDNFKDYIKNIGGNEIRHNEIIDDLGRENLPDAVRSNIEKAKEESIKRIEIRIRGFKEEKNKERFLGPLEKGEIEDLRVVKELEDNLLPNDNGKILEVKKHALDNFRIRIELADNPEEQQKLLRQIGEFSDAKQLELINSANEIISEDKHELLQRMKERIGRNIQERIDATKNQEERKQVFESIIGDQPQSIETLKESLPPEIARPLIKKQMERLERKVHNIEDPARLEIFQQKIEDDQMTHEIIRNEAPDMIKDLEEKRGTLFEKISEEKVMEKIKEADSTISEIERLVAESDFAQKETSVKLLENAKKHLMQAKEALNEKKLGEAFGQATSAINNADNAKKMVKKSEIKKEVMERALEKKQERAESQKTNTKNQKESGEFCAQVITPAVSPEGICKNFPTPCDVPKDWKKVERCQISNERETSNNSTIKHREEIKIKTETKTRTGTETGIKITPVPETKTNITPQTIPAPKPETTEAEKPSIKSIETVPSSAKVLIEGFSFIPSEIKIKTGGTIIFNNNDAAPHNVSTNGNIVVATMNQGQSGNYAMPSKPQTIDYICAIHPSMRGKIIVVE